MKDLAWKLFEQTGNVAYYRLYKELSDNGHDDKSGGIEGDRLQGK
ncbi:MAG: YqzL family protein [Corallococcus sp.]|nr:YqzL family protein [Corallococcus sp.]MCM1359832.1 YqzL family protein [Corallococcus sp.]MCM1395266.1 YqzL family protein [Corallococcus sp.]